LIIATFAGVLIFDEIPYFTTYLGAALIIASSFIIFKREEIKNKKTIITRQV
jgi:drug/metabolite transporter (DMT)-like permease